MIGGSGFIGTHLVEALAESGREVMNLDIAAPQPRHARHWREGSILDARAMADAMAPFQPDEVVHLAAYATMEVTRLHEIEINTTGTRLLLEAVKACPSVRRLVVTSSQHVRKPGSGDPKDDTDFVPYAFFGESKVITERLTREAGLDCTWTIIRPTAVWGPYQPLPADGVWRLLRNRRYLHPAGDPVIRSFGYVKNVVWQVIELLSKDSEQVGGKMFYVGDDNLPQREWIDGFSIALSGRPARKVPVGLIRGLALLGDCLKAVNVRFPIYGSRFHNLTTENSVPIELTLCLLGSPPYSLQEGIRETVEWLTEYYSESPKAPVKSVVAGTGS